MGTRARYRDVAGLSFKPSDAMEFHALALLLALGMCRALLAGRVTARMPDERRRCETLKRMHVSGGSVAALAHMQALWTFGMARGEALSSAALEALEAGVDSESLTLLAGLTRAEMNEAPTLFARALAELGLPSMSKEEAFRLIAMQTARGIVAGKIDAYEGARNIWRAKLQSAVIGHDFDPLVYAASEYEDRPADRAFFRQAIVDEARRGVW